MKFAAVVVAGLATFALPATASDVSEAVAVVQQFAKVGNGTDREAYASFCADDMVIIDHVEPYVFSGPRACQDEWDAVFRWMKHDNVSVTDFGRLAEPSFADAREGRVYAVIPAQASVRLDGVAQTETGAWTFVLAREGRNWRIKAFVWSTANFKPAPAP